MKNTLHNATPNLAVIDPRALVVRGVAYHRAVTGQLPEARVTSQVFDAAGRLVAQRDPRLLATSSQPNLLTLFSLCARPLLSQSVDAGWCLRLYGAAGESRHEWDARHSQRLSEYDALLRPVAITEQAANRPSCVTERFTYADCSALSAAHNQCAQLIRHDDQAGCQTYAGFGLSGHPLAQTRRFLRETTMADWPSALSGRNALLEQDDQGVALIYTTQWQYNALGTVLSQTDALGNTRFNHYDIAGQLNLTRFKPIDQASTTMLVENLTYNACGQLQNETYGNGVTATAIYSPVDGRLQQLLAVKNHKTLQSLSYSYDPVGNVMSLEDAAQPTDWFDGEQVDPVNRYVYDTLGQLIEARGRESVLAATQPGLPGLVLPGGGDASRLRNYTQIFNYDGAGNLLSLKHGQLPQRTMKVDSLSNRSLYQIDASNPPDIRNGFDANGNLLRLAGMQEMHWDVRNQLQRVTQVIREDGINDDEVYVYGADGQRLRKIRVQQAKAVRHVEHVRYLPELEIRTNTATGEVLHVTTLQAGRIKVRRLLWLAHHHTLPDPQWRYSLSDHLGSSALELNDQGNVISHEDYYPFGGTACWAALSLVDATCKVVRYCGKECDATGLYYYGLRYYAPWLQRWINPDPLGVADGLNLFTMVHNNPVAHVDLQGAITAPSEIAQAVVAGAMRDGVSSAVGATARYFSTEALSSLPVNATNIGLITAAGAASGAMAGLYVGGGLGANFVANSRFGDSRAALWAGGIVGGLLGAAAGAAPSVIGCFSAISSLSTATPSHNSIAIGQIGATVNAITREILQQASAELGPRTAWNDRPRLAGVAGAATIYGMGLAGIGASEHLVPRAARSIAGGTAGEMINSVGGSIIRGLHPDAKFVRGTNQLINPLQATKRQGTVHGILTRTAVSSVAASMGLVVAETGLGAGSRAGTSVGRGLGTIAEGRVLTGSFVLEGIEALGFSGADVNNDPTTMNARSQWTASNDDPDIQMTSIRTIRRF